MQPTAWGPKVTREDKPQPVLYPCLAQSETSYIINLANQRWSKVHLSTTSN